MASLLPFLSLCQVSQSEEAPLLTVLASPAVHLEGCCGGRMFDCRDVVFVVGEGEDHDIPIGIDKALEKMQREEQCILYLGPR